MDLLTLYVRWLARLAMVLLLYRSTDLVGQIVGQAGSGSELLLLYRSNDLVRQMVGQASNGSVHPILEIEVKGSGRAVEPVKQGFR